MDENPVTRLRIALGEGDRREIGRSTQVAREVLDNPLILPDLLDCLHENDEAVVSHAAHAIMQIGAAEPVLFEQHADRLIVLLEQPHQWEIGEQAPKVLAELDLTAVQMDRLIPILVRQVDDRSTIAAACALSALKRLADRRLVSAAVANEAIETASRSPRKALAARARQLGGR